MVQVVKKKIERDLRISLDVCVCIISIIEISYTIDYGSSWGLWGDSEMVWTNIAKVRNKREIVCSVCLEIFYM